MFAALQRQKISHFLRTLLLSAGLATLMLLIGYLLMGWEGLVWAGVFSALGIYLSGRIPAAYIMRMYRARKLQPWEAAPLRRSLSVLAGRAGLERAPDLYLIPSGQLNAFATGTRAAPAIALTYGLLQRMSWREITGILAHELAHISQNDLRLKGILHVMGRTTRLFSWLGMFLVLVNFPLFLMGEAVIPWIGIALLVAAPGLSTLLMMAVSRTRERNADLEAARLTGDPAALADALAKLEVYNRAQLMEKLMPRKLLSHPRTQERIARLRALAPRFTPVLESFDPKPLV